MCAPASELAGESFFARNMRAIREEQVRAVEILRHACSLCGIRGHEGTCLDYQLALLEARS